MRILVWHVHGGWMSAFLRGSHEYVIPAAPGVAVPDFPGVRVVPPSQLHDEPLDLVVLQRTEEFALVKQFTGLTAGDSLPAVFVEHNTPKERPVDERHFLADQSAIPVVHVTHFNRLMWDCGDAPTVVIEHGIPDPGAQYTGEVEALGVVVNEPVRRGRVVGTDLLPRFAAVTPLDCFGIDSDRLASLPGNEGRIRPAGDLPTERLHRELAQRRAYLHPVRWTSLGLSLLEAMMLAMPVLALATTEATRAVPEAAGAVSNDPEVLARMARTLMHDPEEARARGEIARAAALERYGLPRFLDDWDDLLHARVLEGALS